MAEISLGCYAGCNKLEKIEIPSNILYIHDQAFSGCRAATGKVIIPATVIKVGNNIFDYCESIESFEFMCDEPPADFNGVSLCRNCVNLTSFTISDNLPIAEQMFAGCASLTEITLNNNYIGNQAFAGCTSLTGVTLNSNYIGMQAFVGCTNLEKVILCNPDITFGTYVFDRCPKLETFGPLADAKGNMENLKYDFNYA
jgi:hypothetical protein